MLDQKLDLQESQDILVNITFDTNVLTDGSGAEERNINWQSPLLSYDLQKSLLRRHKLDEIIDLFQTVRGSATAFRYRDWSDYLASAQPQTTRYGSTTQGVLFPLPDGDRTEFELVKSYQIQGCTHYRSIAFPEVESVTIYDRNFNPYANTDWTFSEGKIIFTVPPAAENGQLLFDGKYDVPVIFSGDRFEYKFITTKDGNGYRIEGLGLEEIRIESEFLPQDEGDSIDSYFQLCGHFQSTAAIEELTEIIDLSSGFDKRTSRFNEPKLSFNLGKIVLWDEELDYLIAFFRCAKGKGRKWGFYEANDIEQEDKIPVRFAEDNLAIRLKKKGKYEIDGIRLTEVFEPFGVFQTPPFSFELQTVTINPEDPNDPVIAASNPTGGSNSNQSQSNNSTQGSYSLSSYSGATGFNSLPDPAITPSQSRWQVSKMFWEAGTLWLIIKSIGNTSANINWMRRGALYRLSSQGNFEYVESDLKEYEMNGSQSPVFARVFKTPTGTSFFVRSSNTVPFGSGAPAPTNGLLRFEVRTDGSLFYDFLEDSIIPQLGVNPPRFNSVVAVFGDRVYVDIGSVNLNKNRDLGIINGLNYVVGNISTSTAGFPINSASNTDNDIFRDTEPFNLYYQQNTDRVDKIYRDRGNDLLEEYFRGGQNLNPSLQSVGQGTDGSIMAKISLGGVCPDNTCTSNFDSRITYEHAVFFSESYNAPIQRFFRTLRPPTSEVTYKFLTGRNSTTWNFNSDKYGNALFVRSSEIIFYRSGDTFAINISSQLPNNLKTNDATTPYGFALFSNSGDLFQPSSNETLVFVQNS